MDFTGRIRSLRRPDRKTVLLATSVLAALAVRLLPYRSAFLGGNVIFQQPDAYSHLRRATLVTKHFPFFPTLDRYMAYPIGAEAPWPPLYDYLIAVLSMVFGLGRPGDTTILVVTTLLPPVIGALTVIPVYLVSRHLFGERAAAWAAVFSVVMPGQLGYSVIGSGDHHTAEVFLLLWTFYLFLKGSADEEGSPGPGSRRSELLSGAVLGTAVLVWQGSLVFATVVVAYVCAHQVVFRMHPGWCRTGDPSRLPGAATRMLTVAAAMTAAARAAIPPGTEQGVFDFGFFSWFQPAYLLVLIAPPWILHVFLREGRGRKAVAAAGLASAALAALLLLAPGMSRNLMESLRFLLRSHPYLASIDEFQPLFAVTPIRGLFEGRLDLLKALYDLLYIVGLFFPPYLVYRTWKDRASRPWGSREIFFALWSLLFLALTIVQKRWANAYGANVAIGVGWVFSSILEKSRVLTAAWREFLEWRESRTEAPPPPRSLFARVFVFWSRSPWLLALSAFFVFLIPYQMLLYSIIAIPGMPIESDFYNSLIWMRVNTPKTSHLYEPTKRPEYSVMAQWDMGHWIQYIAERPTVANNYGYQLRGDGLGDSVRFTLARTEEEAAEICRRRGVRFVFASDVFGPLHDLGKIVGTDFGKEYTTVHPPPHPGAPSMVAPKDEFYFLFYQRMYYFDGGMGDGQPALSRFRLIFESKNPTGMPHAPPDTKKVKIFEVVEGARLEGTGPPGAFVTAAVRLQTNFGRLLEYVAGTTSDGRGFFSIRFPYASADNNYFVTPVSRVLVIGGDRAQFVDVRSQDVLEGRIVRAELRARGMDLGEHR